MWGWKAVERKIEGKNFDSMVEKIIGLGFQKKESSETFVLFHREGTQLTIKGENMPLQLALGKSNEGYIFMQLRYDTFVLFDAGDLEKYADSIVSEIS